MQLHGDAVTTLPVVAVPDPRFPGADLQLPDDLGNAFREAAVRFGRALLVEEGAPPPVRTPAASKPEQVVKEALRRSAELAAATRAVADTAHAGADAHARRTGTRIGVHAARDLAVAPKPAAAGDQMQQLAEVARTSKWLEVSLRHLAWMQRSERSAERNAAARAHSVITGDLWRNARTLAYAHMAVAACQPDPDLRQSQGVVREFVKGRWVFDPNNPTERANFHTLLDYCGAGVLACAADALRDDSYAGDPSTKNAFDHLESRADHARARLEIGNVIVDDPGALRQTPVIEPVMSGAPQHTFQRSPTLSFGF